MNILIKRVYLGPEYTIGHLYDLLDAGETKVFGETAIPYGKYIMDLTMSPKFKRLLPIVLGVRHFTGIRFHKGRIAKHTHGCILSGENKKKGQVLNSEKYEMLIIEKMLSAIRDGEDITLEIV
jgi:hypothetical protein